VGPRFRSARTSVSRPVGVFPVRCGCRGGVSGVDRARTEGRG
jgi:hypothetical protein